MGWLRLVGSLKLQVSLAKEAYKKVYIPQKRPVILRRLLIVATPYEHEKKMNIAATRLIIKEIPPSCLVERGGGLGSRPKKMYGERLGDGVQYHLMSPTPHC